MMWSVFNGYNRREVGRIIDLIQDEVDELNKGRYLVTFENTKYIDFVVINVKVSIGGHELTLLNGELGKSYRLFSPMVDESGCIVMGDREGYIGTVESNSLLVDSYIESNIRVFIRDAYKLMVNVGGYDLGYIIDELSKVGYTRVKAGDKNFMVKSNNYGAVTVHLRSEGNLKVGIVLRGNEKIVYKDFSWLGSDEFFEFNRKVDKLLGSCESHKSYVDALVAQLDSNFKEAIGKELDSLS